MALVGIKIPKEICAELSKLKVPGKKEDTNELHITLFYFSGVLKLDTLIDVIESIVDCTKDQKDFKLKCSKITSFPKGPDGVPIICPVKSDTLIDLRAQIAKKLDKNKLEYSKRFPDYKPHLTLSYAAEEMEDKKIEPIEWKVNEICIWTGEEYKEGMKLSIPLNQKIASVGGKLLTKLSRYR